jgi:hypothetical protein
MDKNYVLILAVIVAAAIVVIAVLLDHLKRNCNSVNRGCPSIPSSQYTDTPSGQCLLKCDQYSDDCYQNCNPKDEECIRQCYQVKAHCYMNCLGSQQESFDGNSDCGCN